MVNQLSVVGRLLATMVGKIKILQFVQRCHQAMGIFPSKGHETHRSINSKSAFFLMFIPQSMATTAAFLAGGGNSMFEYGYGSFVLISALNAFVIYALFMWQMENTLELIEICEDFIEDFIELSL